MNVRVRAVILHDGRLVVSHDRRRGIEQLMLPGGRVDEGESVLDALIREVAEETGLDVVPERLVYVAEVLGVHGLHDLNLVWLARAEGAVDERLLVALDAPEADDVLPPLAGQIAADAARDWAQTPRWLGNIRRVRGG